MPSLTRLTGTTLAVALAYLATATPTLLLPPTPVAPTLLWLAAGVALSAALLGSRAGLLGVALGAFLSAWWMLVTGGTHTNAPPEAWAVALGLVSVVQAVVGAALVRRLAPFPSPL